MKEGSLCQQIGTGSLCFKCPVSTSLTKISDIDTSSESDENGWVGTFSTFGRCQAGANIDCCQIMIHPTVHLPRDPSTLFEQRLLCPLCFWRCGNYFNNKTCPVLGAMGRFRKPYPLEKQMDNYRYLTVQAQNQASQTSTALNKPVVAPSPTTNSTPSVVRIELQPTSIPAQMPLPPGSGASSIPELSAFALSLAILVFAMVRR